MRNFLVVKILLVFVFLATAIFPASPSPVNAATVTHFLPYSPSLGAVRVNRTGLLYKSIYLNAGFKYIEKSDCSSVTTAFCLGSGGEFHDYKDEFSFLRGAIDFSIAAGKKVLASASGVVYDVRISPTAINHIAIKHTDGTVSYYVHVQKSYVSKGQSVKQGQQIGEVGTDEGKFAAHLHYALWYGSQEIKVKFADVSAQAHSGYLRPSRKGYSENYYKSSNTEIFPPNDLFPEGSSSALTISTSSVTLKVCSSVLPGKTVYATAYRGPVGSYSSRLWRYQKVATSTCITFSDMDGAGDTFDNVTYYTVASLRTISDTDAIAKRTSCWVATGHAQLCDGKSR